MEIPQNRLAKSLIFFLLISSIFILLIAFVVSWLVQQPASVSFIWVGAFLVFVLANGFFILQKIKNSLQETNRITNEIDAIAPQNLDKRIEPSESLDELKRLSESVNRLLDRIEGAFQLQQTFISNFSHELKNPLMKMGSQLELGLLKARPPEEYENIMRSILEDLRELGQLSDTLLELAKVGNQSRNFIPATIRIDEILFDVREFLLETQRNCKIFVDFDSESFTEEQLTINGNTHLLRTAFANIIENGCKFSYDGQVKVICSVFDKTVKILIKNRGFGITETDLPQLFDPFFRAEKAATFKGYGIGLPLVHQIIKYHKGKIQVNSIVNEETTFIIEFPLSKEINI